MLILLVNEFLIEIQITAFVTAVRNGEKGSGCFYRLLSKNVNTNTLKNILAKCETTATSVNNITPWRRAGGEEVTLRTCNIWM
jgi:hypothetical protein